MRRYLFTLMLLCGVAYPSSIAINFQTRYDSAINATINATLIQTGAQAYLDKLNSYAAQKATKGVTKAIIAYTNFKPEHVYAALGTVYAIGIKHEIQANFQNPFINGVTNSISLSNSRVFLSFKINF